MGVAGGVLELAIWHCRFGVLNRWLAVLALPECVLELGCWHCRPGAYAVLASLQSAEAPSH